MVDIWALPHELGTGMNLWLRKHESWGSMNPWEKRVAREWRWDQFIYICSAGREFFILVQ